MNTSIHPTHARTTRTAVAVLAGMAVAAFVVAFYLADGTGTSPASVLPVAAFILFGSICMLVGVARGFVCRCPGCAEWLTRQPQPRTDAQSRRFICTRCSVMWDTGIRLSIGGD